MFSNLGKTFVLLANKVGFWTRKNSPQLLVATAVLSAGAAVVLAVKATTKLEPIAEKTNHEIKLIKDKMADDSKLASGEYSLPVLKRELFGAYSKAVWEYTKLYAPTALTFSLSVFSMLTSHKIMRGRNLALASAYTALENVYSGYRERVKAKIGEKAEQEIFRNIYSEDVTETNEKGKEVTSKVKTPHLDPEDFYNYIFDSSNSSWRKSATANYDQLLMIQHGLNMRLRQQGYLFLSDVFEALDIEECSLSPAKLKASHFLGWIYNPDDPNHKGDNWVSFGISDEMGNLTAESQENLRGNQRDIWLEFNPDGDILNGSVSFMDFTKK